MYSRFLPAKACGFSRCVGLSALVMGAFTQSLSKISQHVIGDSPDALMNFAAYPLRALMLLAVRALQESKGESCSHLLTHSLIKVLSCLRQCQIQKSKQVKIIRAPLGSRIARAM
jgi:hypothetical protein